QVPLAGEYLVLVDSGAEISITGATIVGGAISLIADADITTPTDAQEFVVVTADSIANVAVTDSVVDGSGDVTIGSDSSVISTASAEGFTGADATADAAVGTSVVNSDATTDILGSSRLASGGSLLVRAWNNAQVTTKGDASGATVGGGIATSAVTMVTRALINANPASPFSAASFHLHARSTSNVVTEAMASPGGAEANSSGNDPDAATQGNAETSSGAIPVAAAIAFSKLDTDTTAAVIAALGGLTIITISGEQRITAESVNASSAVADGTAVDASAASTNAVGVAVAVNLVDITNHAYLDGAVTVTAPGGLFVEAITPIDGVFLAKATSGASGSGVAVAVSFALNVVSVDAFAKLLGTANVAVIGGNGVTLKANSTASSTTQALPADPAATGGDLGVGSSVALSIVNDTVIAGFDDLADLTGAGALSIVAAGGHATVTTAQTGAKGSVALAPAIAVTISNITRNAWLGTSTPTLALDSLSVTARGPPDADNSVVTTAAGSAEGSGSAAVGVALALTVANHSYTASTARNISATGNVSFEALGVSSSSSEATASSSGAPGEGEAGSPSAPATDGSGGGGVNEQIDGERQQANDTATHNSVDGSTSSPNSPDAQDSSGTTISVAAAIAINIATSESIALIGSGVSVTSGGVLTIKSSADTDATTTALGKAASGSGTLTVGAGVAINLVNVTNTASTGTNTTINAGDLTVEAIMTPDGDSRHSTGAEARSGASGGGTVGIAGSFALNIANTTTTAVIPTSSTVALTSSDVTITAASVASSSVAALPATDDGTADGSSVGIGASVALNIITDKTTADLAGTVNGAAVVAVTATAENSAATAAKNGAAGGIAVAPVVGVMLSTVTTTARLSAGALLTTTGAVRVEATQTASAETEASGDTEGETAAVGIALALTIAKHTVTAATARSVDAAGDVTFGAVGASSSSSDATASAAGAPGEDADGDGSGADTDGDGRSDVNDQVLAERNSANQQASDNGGDDSTGTASTPSAEDSSGATITVAAAIGINLATSSSTARIPNLVTITSGGTVGVTTSANTDAAASADGSAADGDASVSVGLAVAINLVNLTNSAMVEGVVVAEGLAAIAGMTETADDDVRRWTGSAWEVVDAGETLPLTKLYQWDDVDEEWKLVPSGTELPAVPGDSVEGDAFRLTTGYAGNVAGIYKYDATPSSEKWAHQPGAPDTGSVFPDEPEAKDLFILTPVANAYFHLLETDGKDPAGIHQWNEGTTSWDHKSLVSVAHGVALPAAPGADTFFRVAEHEFGSAATSGAGGDVSFAVSLALNIVNADSRGEIAGTASVTITPDGPTGDVIVAAASNAKSAVVAKQKEPVVGGSVGVGAAVALSIVNDIASATIAAGAGFDTAGAGDVNVIAHGGHAMVTSANAGASSDGVSFVPAVAISISNVTREAAILGIPSDVVALSGALMIAARTPTTLTDVDTNAKGAAKSSGSAAIGISVALTFATHLVTATTQRNINADGDVTIEAIGQSRSSAVAEASAQGAPADEDEDGDGDPQTGENVDTQILGQRNQADSQADDNRPSGATAGSTGSGDTTTPSSENEQSNGGPIAVAGAIAVNLSTSLSSATIPAGVSIRSGGTVKVAASANTDAKAIADGSASEGGGTATVGVAVAINLVNLTNIATVAGTVIDSHGLIVNATMTNFYGDTKHEFESIAISGATGDGVSVAISFALNIVNANTTAELTNSSSSTVSSNGVADIKASALSTSKVEARPKETVKGGSAGIGISVALSIVNDRAHAGITGGAIVNFTGAGDVAVISLGGHNMTTTAEAGAGSTGVTVVPAIAVSISNVTRSATVGAGTLMQLGGSLTIAGRAPPSDNLSTTTAKGSAESDGGSAAIGVALALGIGTHTVAATLERSVTAGGDVTVEAIGRSRIFSDATASAEGAPGDSSADGTGSAGTGTGGNQGVDGQVQGERDQADSQALSNGAGADNSGSEDTPSSENSNSGGGPVSVAAAIAVNIATSSSIASIADGLTINAGGFVTIRSSANSDGKAIANGKARSEGGSAGIAAAVALNVSTITNTASTGNGTITSNGLNVEALMTDSNLDEVRRWNGTEWVLIESGTELPEVKVWQFDAPALMSDEDPKWEPIAIGDEFPDSPTPDDMFDLKQEDDGKSPAVYKWNGSAWVEQTVNGTTFEEGTEFPSDILGFFGPDDKDLYRLFPEADTYFRLTEDDGDTAAGIYKWNASAKEWQLQSGSIGQGSFLPDDDSDDPFFRLSEHESAATTQAGAGSDDVGVGGAVSINIVTATTTAIVNSTSVDAGSGNSNIEAHGNHRDIAVAVGKATGGSVGVGIGLALNILIPVTRAEIQNGTSFTGSDDLTVKATTRQETITTAEAGSASSDGVAVSPSVALVIATPSTVARIGAHATDLLDADGAVSVEANYRGTFHTMADAEAGGKSVAVGAAIGISVVTPEIKAGIFRDVTGGSIAVTTDSWVTAETLTKAGASGSSDDSDGDGDATNEPNADAQAQSQVDGNPAAAGTSTTLPDAESSTDQANAESSGESGQGSSGVGVAASIAVNVVIYSPEAIIASNVHVTATGGPVVVRATNHTDGTAKATGTSLVDDASANVGAAVGLNVVTVFNTATIGSDATIVAKGVTVEAVTVAGEINEFVVWGLAAAGGTQSDVSVGASIGVNVIIFHNIASIGANADVTSNPGGINMVASAPIGLQNIAFSGALGDTAVGAAVGVNVLVIHTKAFIDTGADVDATGAINIDASASLSPMDMFEEDIPIIGNITVSSVVAGGALSGGDVAVGGSVLVDVFELETHAYIAGGVNANLRVAGTPGQQHISVTAVDDTHLVNGAGGLGGSTGSVGVGAGVVVEVIVKDVRAYIGAGTDARADGNVTITGMSSETLLDIAASIAASNTAAISASIVVAVVTNGTRAYIESTSGNTTRVLANGNMTIEATDTGDIQLYAGGLAVSAGSAGVGVSTAILVKTSTTEAFIGSTVDGAITASNAEIQAWGSTGLTISATQDLELILLAVAGGGASTAGIAGSVDVNILTHFTKAYIGNGTKVNESQTGAQGGQGVAVAATDTTTIFGLAGALAVGGSVGVGAGVDVEVVTKHTYAWIGDDATVNALGNITVDATSSEKVTTVSVGAGFAGNVAVTVNASVPVFTIWTQAWIGDDAVVAAEGSVRVAADEALKLDVIAGNISGSGTVAVGAAVAVPIVTKETHAWIGDRAKVDAAGKSTITIKTGTYDVSTTDIRFDGATAVESGDVINVGYDHNFADGQEVLYDAGNGTPISGLVDGEVYYVRTHSNSNKLQLEEWAYFTPSVSSGDTLNLGYDHGFNDFQEVRYSAGDGGTPITGLVEGGVYYAQIV
ncbi:MAG: hypothetical protein U9R51_06700, partial [Actinomycetota bacterium]|nr:hypothetical protein [Actinomycetota bacterium]